jgi:surface polysaccharide O-acyltransferase-like enzyme
VAGLLPGTLPTPLAALIARLPLQDGIQPALFPLFPWFAYACFGAALGSLLNGARAPEAMCLRAAMLGAALAMCTSEALPYVHRIVQIYPFAVGPIRTGFRVGIVLTLMAIGIAWVDKTRGRNVIVLGQHSLRIYWAHMLFAYGVLGRPLQHNLGYPAWLGFAGLLLVLMWIIARIVRVIPRGGAFRRSGLSQNAGESISLSPDT